MPAPARQVTRTRVRVIALFLAVTVLLGAAGLVLLDRAGFEVRRKIWLAKQKIFGIEEIGIWRNDERLGWVHIPSSSGRQRVVPDFDVRYHIDARGHRRTPGAPRGERPSVLFLGGSFTFGHGVEDHEVFPALLQQRWPERRVLNAGVSAYGTAQALLVLRDALDSDGSIELVVYGFVTHHLKRNAPGRDWLDTLEYFGGRRNPHFVLEGGRLEFRGLADPERDGLPAGPELTQMEYDTTLELLREMSRLCRERGIPLVAVYLPDGTRAADFPLLVAGVGGDSSVDLRDTVDYASFRFPHDSHLNAAGHRAISLALAPELQRRAALTGVPPAASVRPSLRPGPEARAMPSVHRAGYRTGPTRQSITDAGRADRNRAARASASQ